jgi:membrane-associated HD superfamily phosphohydrolase
LHILAAKWNNNADIPASARRSCPLLENLLVVVIIAMALMFADRRSFARSERRTKVLYILLLLPASYLSLLFILQLPWFNIGHLTKAMYGWPARQIVALLK